MNNHKNTNEKDSSLEKRLAKQQKTKLKKQRKYLEITAQINSALKKSKDRTRIEKKLASRRRIAKDLTEVKNEISSIRRAIRIKQEQCSEKGHKYVLLQQKETDLGTLEIKRCKICGDVISELFEKTNSASPRLTYKPSYYKQAE